MNLRAIVLGALAVLAVWTPATGGAATIPATSCEEGDVRSALGKADAGDVVTVPAGKCTWTQTLNIPTKVTLMGAGADQTIIVDEVVTALTDSSRSWAVLEWRPGDAYEVRHVITMFDSAGRGKSDPISGVNPAPEGWPNQLSEPIYIHNNTIDGAVRKMSAQGGRLKEGVDFIHGPPPAEITEAWPPYPHPLVANAPAPGGR